MIMWNRLRYTVWAPVYDAIARAAGFDSARRLSIDRLRLAPSDRVLIVGAGTGLDLDFLPSNVHVTAIDSHAGDAEAPGTPGSRHWPVR